MSLPHESISSSMHELPERYKAFGRLIATEKVFRERYSEDIGLRHRNGWGIYVSFGLERPEKVSGLSIPGADAVDLIGIRYPDSGSTENSDPLIHLGFTIFSKDGSYIGVSGEKQKVGPLEIGCSAFFGAEMPPFVVDDKEYYAAVDAKSLPDGRVVRNTPSESILRLENRHLLTDTDCEILTGLVEANIDNTWFV